jgi:hypothetical protein
VAPQPVHRRQLAFGFLFGIWQTIIKICKGVKNPPTEAVLTVMFPPPRPTVAPFPPPPKVTPQPPPSPDEWECTCPRQGSVSAAAVTSSVAAVDPSDARVQPVPSPPVVQTESPTVPVTFWAQQRFKPKDSNDVPSPPPSSITDTECGFSTFGVCWDGFGTRDSFVRRFFGRRLIEGSNLLKERRTPH